MSRGRPPVPAQKRRKNVQFSMSELELAALDRQVATAGVSRSEFVRAAVELAAAHGLARRMRANRAGEDA